ncbi:MAG: hypothetical protein ACK5PZ_06445 [Pirellula sp.]
MSNPYSPTTTQSIGGAKAPRWWRRFAILNAALIIAPATVVLFIYLWVKLFGGLVPAATEGGPVLYEHTVWIEVDPWGLAALFLIPNGILLAMFVAWWLRLPKPESEIKDSTEGS